MKDYTKLPQGRVVDSKPHENTKPAHYARTNEGNAKQNKKVALPLFIVFCVLIIIVSITIFNKLLPEHEPQTKVSSKQPIKMPAKVTKQEPAAPVENYENPFPQIQQQISIANAYAAYNVPRYPFSKQDSNLPANISEYLEELFTITDFLVIERVQNHKKLLTGQKLELSNYDPAIKKLKEITVPAQLTESHALILSAVKSQKEYFQHLQQSKEALSAGHYLVKKVHSELLLAWKMMGKSLKTENRRNLYSFEKHLCALDFI